MVLYLLYSGKGEAIETTLAALQVVPEPFRSFANTLVDICAYAGELEMLLPFKLPFRLKEHGCNLLMEVWVKLNFYSLSNSLISQRCSLSWL